MISLIEFLRLENKVVLHGALKNEAVCKLIATTSALILPSIEEQFGNVVIEAQAMGVPVIISENCGCWDHLVRNGLNGFIIEPDNTIGLVYYMKLISSDAVLWRRMCMESQKFVELGDVASFARGVQTLLEKKHPEIE